MDMCIDVYGHVYRHVYRLVRGLKFPMPRVPHACAYFETKVAGIEKSKN